MRGGDIMSGVSTFFLLLLLSCAFGAGVYFYLSVLNKPPEPTQNKELVTK